MTPGYDNRLDKNLGALWPYMGYNGKLFFSSWISLTFPPCMHHFGEVSEVDTMPRPASQNIDPAEAGCHHFELFTVAEKSWDVESAKINVSL